MSKRVVTFVAVALPTLVMPALALPAFAYVETVTHVAAAGPAPTVPKPGETPTPPPFPPPTAGDTPGTGKGQQLRYEYGIDRKAWYWAQQRDEELAAGPVSQRARFPSPQRPETLPVAVESGQPTKVSAVRFDLVGHGIPPGSTMSRFVLAVAEGTDPGEVPTANPEGHKLYACTANEFWPNGEAETWETSPEATDECAPGKRLAGDTQAYWTFDLSGMAAEWAEDPVTNNGVVLTGVAPGAAGKGTWQVNLKAPRADNPVTPTDEYEETSHRLFATVVYDPAELGDVPGGAAALPDPPGAPPGGGLSSGSGLGSSDLGGAAGKLGGTAEPAGAVDAKPTSASTTPFTPKIPWYVWALIPLTLLVTTTVRAALAETPGVTRPGGVIETIRSRNAAQWGPVETEPEGGLLARLTRFLPFGQGDR